MCSLSRSETPYHFQFFSPPSLSSLYRLLQSLPAYGSAPANTTSNTTSTATGTVSVCSEMGTGTGVGPGNGTGVRTGTKMGAVPSFLDEGSHSAYSSVSISLLEARQLLDRAAAHMVVIPRLSELRVSHLVHLLCC